MARISQRTKNKSILERVDKKIAEIIKDFYEWQNMTERQLIKTIKMIGGQYVNTQF